jgi:hypothetical protein
VQFINNGNPADKMDIVFLPANYKQSESNLFANDVQTHAKDLLNTEPFKSYKNRININYVNEFIDLGCKFAEPRLIVCDSSKVSTLAAKCNHDYIVVIFKTTEWRGSGGLDYAVASSSYTFITIHELGHTIGLLMDEYDYGTTGSLYYSGANCDNNSNCIKWSNVPGTGCYSTCSYKNLYRATNNCIMLSVTNRFCPVCERQIKNILNKYK